MTRGPSEHPEVVCVTTGSKVINGGCLSLEGSVLNDCHAEILARRALIHFLYDQIEAYASRPSESIFEQDKNGGQRLKLKDNILFHLYISSAPCGDARIFTLNDAQDPLKDLHPNRLSRGTLRTKIESGEGSDHFKLFHSGDFIYGFLRHRNHSHHGQRYPNVGRYPA